MRGHVWTVCSPGMGADMLEQGGCGGAGGGRLSVAQNLKRHFWEDSAAFEHVLCGEPGLSAAGLSLEPRMGISTRSKLPSQVVGEAL